MQKLLLLHGALGAASQYAKLIDALKNHFEIYAFDFSGHGGMPFAKEFSIERFTEETLAFLNENRIDQTNIFGYSMGGYVALNFALNFPNRVGKIMTLATKFDWTPESTARETKMLDPAKMEEKIPAFAAMLRERHAPNDWAILLRKTADMMLDLSHQNLLNEDALQQIHHLALICLGVSDQMVSRTETERTAAALPNGKLHIFEATQHPFEKVNVEMLAGE
ncbi:MAG: alpha/beta fold hydrolase, partial [Bacteroidota bacterium]